MAKRTARTVHYGAGSSTAAHNDSQSVRFLARCIRVALLGTHVFQVYASTTRVGAAFCVRTTIILLLL